MDIHDCTAPGEVVRDNEVNDFAVEYEFEHIGNRTMILNARRLRQVDVGTPSILLAIEDITDRKRAEQACA